MANRRYNQFFLALEKNVVRLYANVSFGAAGAPTLSTSHAKGIASMTRISAGLYDIKFGYPASSTDPVQADLYYALLAAQVSFQKGTAPSSPDMFIVANNVSTTGVIRIEFNAAGVATDPASGEIAYLAFDLSNSIAA